MDYQELEAFKKMSPEARELKMVEDLDAVKTGIEKLTTFLESESCPFASCQLKTTVDGIDDRVDDLETASANMKENRRTWTDYMVNSVIAFGSVLLGIFIGRGG